MSSTQDFIKYVIWQTSLAWNISYKKMFWDYWFYLNWKIIALVCDNQFFLKPTNIWRELLEDNVIETPPYKGAKNYFLIEDLENREFLADLLQKTYLEISEGKSEKMLD